MTQESEKKEVVLSGIKASPGICIGKAYLVDREGVDIIKRYGIPKSSLQNEKNRFKTAVKHAKDELHTIIENTPEGFRQHADILETHVVLLEDKMLIGRTIDTIANELINAEWALKKVVLDVKSMFQDIADPYLRDRALDIVHVSERIMRNLVGVNSVNIADIEKRVILVAHDLSPAQTSQINLERIMGFVTVLGGMASHTSIIARTLGIPAVQGVADVTRRIRNDDIIVLDGTAGNVIIDPSEKTLIEYGERQVKYETYRASIARSSHQPAETSDGLRISVMGNIEQPEQIVSVIDNGGEGIGLFRTEFQYLSRPDFPDEDELFEKYQDVVEVMAPRPVTIRTLDINGDKALQNSVMTEINPALGLRAIRYCLKRPEIFKSQLKAILRAAALGEVRILFPMIATYEELRASKELLDDAAEMLEKESVEYSREIEIGIMVEVPSVALMADIMAAEVDFLSIGTNDLIQYTMAVDRSNKEVAYLYNPLHPAILRMLKYVSDVAKAGNTRLFICGEMAGDPFNLPLLLGLGFDELSMNPQSIPTAKSIIRALSAADTVPFMEKVLKQTSAKDVSELIQKHYGGVISAAVFQE